MNCQRCKKEQRASHRVESDVMIVDVCDDCAAVAWDILQWQPDGVLGMIQKITPLKEATE